MQCFVCDASVTDHMDMRDVILENSNTPLLEKLGQLFPERFYLVCENDVVCSDCVATLNELDLIDEERAKLRKHVLGRMEKKYKLNDGDLCYPDEVNEAPGSFAAKKRQSGEELEKIMSTSSDDPRSRIWMECKTCKYTTNYTQFVMRHVKKTSCEICGGRVDKFSNCIQKCTELGPPRENGESPMLNNMSSESMLLAEILQNEEDCVKREEMMKSLEDEERISEEEEGEDETKESYCNVLDGEECSEAAEAITIHAIKEETNSLASPYVLKTIKT